MLHALGSARPSWDPVIDRLAERFDVIAVDLPGFGDSAPLPSEPSPLVLATNVADFLDRLGIAAPHVAGNSLGGWVALELAGLRPVASLTLLGPAGLWRGRPPLYNRVSLRATRWLAEHGSGVLRSLMSYRVARILVLGQTHGRPARISPEYARMAVHAMATASGFPATMKATESRAYRSGPPIDAPVTVAFGTRDHLLLRASRHLDELPPHTVVESIPGGGHVPMADNPEAVVALITTTALRPRPAKLSTPVTVVDLPPNVQDGGRSADTSPACHDGASTTVSQPASTVVDPTRKSSRQ